MLAFKHIIAACAALLMTACSTNIDYVVHGYGDTAEPVTIIEYVEVEVEPDAEIWIDSFTQVGAFEEIDILWVIDKSCSMNAHNGALLDGVEAMMNSLPTDVNWRLKMITAGTRATQATTFPLTRGDTPADALNMLSQLPADGSEMGFEALKDYVMNDTYAQTWLRYDAAFLVVFVSDEEEQSFMSTGDFNMWYENFRRSVYMASIVNVESADSVCDWPPAGNMIGSRYIESTDYFAGNVIDICEDDWATAVEEATNEIEPHEDYMLTHIPYEATVVVFADGAVYYDWHFDATENKVYFDVIPAEGVHIEIGYEVKEYSYIRNHTAELDVNNSSTSP